jgi:CRP-like cAMP-binding protein
MSAVLRRQQDGPRLDGLLPARSRSMSPGTLPPPTVYLRGDLVDLGRTASTFGRIEAGLFAMVRADSRHHDAVIELRGTGSTMGEGGLLTHEFQRGATAFRALVPSRVRWLDPALVPASPPQDVVRAVLAVLAVRTRHQQDRAFRRCLQSTAQRVAESLVDLSHETSLGNGGSALEHIRRSDLAQIVGGNRSSVTTICSQFERRGWCRLLGRPGASIDAPALTLYAERGPRPVSERPHARLRASQESLWGLLTAVPANASTPRDPAAARALTSVPTGQRPFPCAPPTGFEPALPP